MNRRDIFELIQKERARQNKLHPSEQAFIEKAPSILGEEVGEVHKAVIECDVENLKEELIHTAAVAVRWLELFK